jgi:ABC-type Na+ transport system ATPase subunit NatA/DNA-binding SARP family transcriptional activator
MDRLVDLTWPGSPPHTAQHAIHSRVSRLRAALADSDTSLADVAILTRGSSYMLRADPWVVDAHRFRAQVARARADTDDLEKVSVLRGALSMWHGPPLADVATPSIADQLCRGLEEAKLAAQEECLDAELRLGRHAAVTGELMELAAHHPYRQHILAQLMLALYRSGRGPDALATYRLARHQLADELGLDPEPRLQRLYSAILGADPALELSGLPPETAPPPIVARHDAGRTVHLGAGPPPQPATERAREGAVVSRLDDAGSVPARRTRRIGGSHAATTARTWFRVLGRIRLPAGASRPSGPGRDSPPARPDPARCGQPAMIPLTRHRPRTWLLAREWVVGLRERAVAMATVTVEAMRLTKRYGQRTAEDDLSFTARQGEVLGLLGANGAGKTTTIRLLTTMLTPTGGEFSVAGIPSDRQREIRRRVGVLPESAGYPAHQTGLDYLVYHARLFGMTRPDATRIAGRLLAELGLDERAGTRISTYSRGMRQRLGIARALLNEPAVVFLDEPTLGLDPAGQRQVLGIIRDIAQRSGATVLLSTHALTEVEEGLHECADPRPGQDGGFRHGLGGDSRACDAAGRAGARTGRAGRPGDRGVGRHRRSDGRRVR